jgi:hypothetical protein
MCGGFMKRLARITRACKLDRTAKDEHRETAPTYHGAAWAFMLQAVMLAPTPCLYDGISPQTHQSQSTANAPGNKGCVYGNY